MLISSRSEAFDFTLMQASNRFCVSAPVSVAIAISLAVAFAAAKRFPSYFSFFSRAHSAVKRFANISQVLQAPQVPQVPQAPQTIRDGTCIQASVDTQAVNEVSNGVIIIITTSCCQAACGAPDCDDDRRSKYSEQMEPYNTV